MVVPGRSTTLTNDQFYDYTKQPIHEALVQNPPSSKFDVILEAVGQAYVPLFTQSEVYLAPNGTYISVGPVPHGLGETLGLLWNVFLRPRWAGGTKRRFECVLDCPSFVDLSADCEISPGRLIKLNKTAELLDDIAKMITDGKPFQSLA